MDEAGDKSCKGQGFGPIFSRLYSFFVSRSRKSAKSFRKIVGDISQYNPRKVLDVGCGPGVLIGMLSDAVPDAKIYGADPSPSMVAIARKRLSEKILSGKVVVTQGSSLDVGYDEKFDLIVTSMSFHHWEDKGKSLGYLKSLLAEGGSIIIYESLGSNSAGEDGKMRHSLSMAEAEEIRVDGLHKTVKADGDLISVKLSL